MIDPSQQLRRTDPDYVTYVPEAVDGRDAENQHFIVRVTPRGTFLAIRTQASIEAAGDQRVVSARSTDQGETWSEPVEVDGPDDQDDGGMASWGFPVLAPGVTDDGGDRIYCLYVKNVGVNDSRAADTGALRYRYSEDDGRSWSDETFDLTIEPCAISNPNPDVPESWIVYQQPTVLDDGTVLAPFTHWASDACDVDLTSSDMFNRHSEVRFLRFENIREVSDPSAVTVTTWPDADHGLQVPHPERPGISVAQEPTAKHLPDGRLICALRTLQGQVYFALSDDDGRTWDTPRPLCYGPDEDDQPIENPIAPCPLYETADDRLLLVFYNNDGTGHGAAGPTDTERNRTPAWYTVGEYVDHPSHPVRFDKPRILVDNGFQSLGAEHNTRQTATYTSFFEQDGRAYFWYPDGKYFLLGKDISDELALTSPGE
jgi:hypothetical protein